MVGFGVAGALGASYLVTEYQSASSELLTSSESLHVSINNLTSHIQRIDTLEKRIQYLEEHAAYQNDIQNVRSELRKAFEGTNSQMLQVKSDLNGIEGDLTRLSRMPKRIA